MGRKFTPEASPFYPPRARWFSALLYFGDRLRRGLRSSRILPPEMKPGELVTGFLIPGLAVYFRAPWLWGLVALSASAVLFLAYVIWLGSPAANLAFGLLLSIHSAGFAYYCNPLIARDHFRSRLTFTLLVLLTMMFLLYWPARTLVQQHLLTPLRIDGHVFVVEKLRSAQTIGRGDWVAYTLNESTEMPNGVWFQGGDGLGPVLAVGGDRIVFSGNNFSVNRVLHPAWPHMPVSGEWVVPEKHWFIWPNLAISGHGNVGDSTLSSALLGLADVSPERFLGRPFRHWFGRPQHIP